MKKLRIMLGRVAKNIFRPGISFINSRPRLRQYAVTLIQWLGFYTAARSLFSRLNGISHRSGIKGLYGSTAEGLPPRARQIYAELKDAIERKQGQSS